ncbi:MAG: polysaccharide deacetylase family protein [Halanaerobiaceae bacterium]
MNFVLTPRKKIIISLGLAMFAFIFLTGFLLGNRYGEVISVINQKLVPIYEVDRDDKLVSITVDGTWGASQTDELLEILRQNDITITFFFAGYWLKKYPNTVKRIAAEGHEIENHSLTHPHFNPLSRDKIKEEIESTSDLIEDLIGKRPKFFRPPFGEYNNKVIQTLDELGYQTVQWSVDSHDWMEPGVDYIVKRVMDNIKSGGIILMHNSAPDTPEALKIIISKLKEKGYKIVPLSELVYKDNYYIESYSGKQVKKKGGSDN